MPKSKRAKVVHLSKTTKKGKELTLKLFANIRSSIDTYPYIFVFAVDNMRNTHLKDVRTQLSDSRLFFGKTKVMAKALGTTPEEEHATNTSLLSPHLHGTVGLLFTPRSPSQIRSYFSDFHPLDFARAGTTASRAFTLPPGTLYSRGGEISVEDDVPLSHTIEPTLRKLGVPTRLVKGRVELQDELVVCREGDVLGARETALLKMFGVAMSEFGVEVRAWWSAATGEVTVAEEGEGMEVEGGGA